MKNILKQIKREKTVSAELTRQGYLTEAELIADWAYNDANVNPFWHKVYRFFAPVVVVFMRIHPKCADITMRIGWKIWLEKSITEGYVILIERAKQKHLTPKARRSIL